MKLYETLRDEIGWIMDGSEDKFMQIVDSIEEHLELIDEYYALEKSFADLGELMGVCLDLEFKALECEDDEVAMANALDDAITNIQTLKGHTIEIIAMSDILLARIEGQYFQAAGL